MEASPVDPEYMPPPEEGQLYPFINDSLDPEAAECPVHRRIEAVKGLIGTAEGFGLEAGGYLLECSHRQRPRLVHGNLASHEKTAVTLELHHGQGQRVEFPPAAHESWGSIPGVARALGTGGTRSSCQRRSEGCLSPVSTSIILEPQAVADLLPFLAWSMDARRADDGLTVFSGKQGKKVSGQRFTTSLGS
ncbi:MAG: metallopeptidase TldD-related protein [Desulfomicrobium escambiense]|nr:metallopeptidase TldD-related protein [Desulfomicrobium escambiense]